MSTLSTEGSYIATRWSGRLKAARSREQSSASLTGYVYVAGTINGDPVCKRPLTQWHRHIEVRRVDERFRPTFVCIDYCYEGRWNAALRRLLNCHRRRWDARERVIASDVNQPIAGRSDR